MDSPYHSTPCNTILSDSKESYIKLYKVLYKVYYKVLYKVYYKGGRKDD